MRGASAPPLSPPLLPRLLCIQIHLPPNQTRRNGSSLANPTVWSRTELQGICGPVVEPDGQYGCAQTGSVGTLLCAPTCAPLMPRFFAQCGPYESQEGRRGGTLGDGWKSLWNLEPITHAGLDTAAWRRSSLSFRAMKRAQTFAHRCTADRGGETLRERGCGGWHPETRRYKYTGKSNQLHIAPEKLYVVNCATFYTVTPSSPPPASPSSCFSYDQRGQLHWMSINYYGQLEDTPIS